MGPSSTYQEHICDSASIGEKLAEFVTWGAAATILSEAAFWHDEVLTPKQPVIGWNRYCPFPVAPTFAPALAAKERHYLGVMVISTTASGPRWSRSDA
jgi:hypothetical protein